MESHIYGEIQNAITREDEDLLGQAINAAVSEVSSYLNRYDVNAIFSATENQRHPLILLYTKDIAAWHFIQLANASIDLDLRERRYELATGWLTKVQAGKVTPDLPIPAPEDEDSQFGDEIRYGNARKRNRGYL